MEQQFVVLLLAVCIIPVEFCSEIEVSCQGSFLLKADILLVDKRLKKERKRSELL